MAGVALSITQPNGVITTWATVLDIRWQPGKSADVQIGFFLTEGDYTGNLQPVCTQYVPLDITQIDPAGNIPQQIFNQLTASGAPLAGGTLTS